MLFKYPSFRSHNDTFCHLGRTKYKIEPGNVTAYLGFGYAHTKRTIYQKVALLRTNMRPQHSDLLCETLGGRSFEPQNQEELEWLGAFAKLKGDWLWHAPERTVRAGVKLARVVFFVQESTLA